ncbi:helix-turn-helix domain-containing protein, partial [Paenibacillus sp. EKM208P]
AVFGLDGDSDSATIVEHIKNIRAKLGKVEVSPVETVWGIGYRWK